MPAVHVRNVSAEVLTALKERASKNQRSLQQEMLQILTQAAAEPPRGQHHKPITLNTVRTDGRGEWGRSAVYDDAR